MKLKAAKNAGKGYFPQFLQEKLGFTNKWTLMHEAGVIRPSF
jgi:hypothetical protein